MSSLSTLLLLLTTIATFHSPQTAFNSPNAPWRPLPPSPPSETTTLLSAASDNAPSISNHHIRHLAHVVYAPPHPATIKQHRRPISATAGTQTTTAPSILDGFDSFQPSSPHRRIASGHSPQFHHNPSTAAAAKRSCSAIFYSSSFPELPTSSLHFLSHFWRDGHPTNHSPVQPIIGHLVRNAA
jgi:hypothetical protein